MIALIGYWHHHVVRLSVCNAVHRGFHGRCTGLKVVPACSYNRHVPFCPFRHFCCRMYRIVTKRTGKNESKKTRTWVFWDRESGVRWPCYVLLFTDFVNFDQSRLNGLSFGAFINSITRWIGSCVPAVRQLVTETGLIVYVVRSTIGCHINSWTSCSLTLSRGFMLSVACKGTYGKTNYPFPRPAF